MQNQQNTYVVQKAKSHEMINFYDIMANQDWDPFVRGEQLTEATDPEGCFLGKLNGEVISSILALKYGKFGLISIYWVNEKYRGKGYGLKIFNKGMEYLKDCEIIGLDSVDEQVLNYEKYGFIKHSTSIKGMTKNRSDQNYKFSTKIFSEKNDINAQQVANFDSQHFPSHRGNYLKKAIEIGHPIVSYDFQTNKILGYGIVSSLLSGLTISPLVATTPEAAEDIIQTYFRNHKAQLYEIFYSAEHEGVFKIIKKWFPDQDFTLTRMYYKTKAFKQDFDSSCIYGYSGFDRG